MNSRFRPIRTRRRSRADVSGNDVTMMARIVAETGCLAGQRRLRAVFIGTSLVAILLSQAAISSTDASLLVQTNAVAVGSVTSTRTVTATLSTDTMFDPMLSPGLSSAGAESLSKFIDSVGGVARLTRLVVTGHTDPLGSSVFNQRLSLAQANAVRAYFIRRGVQASVILSSGVGEGESIATQCPMKHTQVAIACFSPDRRVELRAEVEVVLSADLDSAAKPVDLRFRLNADKRSASNSLSEDSKTELPTNASATMQTAFAPTLASAFRAQAIRDRTDGTIQIRFLVKPTKALLVKDSSDRSLDTKWDDASDVLSFQRTDRFVVTDGVVRVEVARVSGSIYDFCRQNGANLEAVFDKHGATYFKFADSVKQVSVLDDQGRGQGRQAGRYYKFDGVPNDYAVTADGTTISVSRKTEVRFYEREARS